ncbi:hypothetical protein [Commensalibacter oyaizuii]|uniref:Uncharacterized protein n=1 Tax=Commensalibacter oyaizuii TaxID=3043873 RepID=A0ABT6PZ58_9PROT|nr:hypothetical protein [Commensalibacter sp. TBRC 16381]MDI2090018.1 hypothetical protein [Commensalibacter sp. TBRC 16381]
MPVPLTRRRLLHLLAIAGTAATYPLIAKADELSPVDSSPNGDDINSLSLIVGSPQNSDLGRWSSRIASAFAQGFQFNDPLPLRYTTGYDGVTAANLFDTRIAPDGNTALITSGNTIIAAMAGDKRVHFDYERWIPIITTLSPSIAIARQPFHNSIPDLLKNRTMKVAVSNILGKELPTLLGISLLQINAVPVTGLTTHDMAVKALRNREVDVIQLSTAQGFADLPILLKEGFHVFFSLDNSTQYGPNFISLYNQLHHSREGNTLLEAWNALTLAARMDIAVILPMLTPSALVTKWRLCTSKVLQTPDIIQIAQQSNLTFQENPACNDTINQMSPSIITTMALRRWLTMKMSKWEK